MLIGKRVVTSEDERGFISQTYIGGVDVDVLEYDAEDPENTTTFYYEAGEYEVSKDQTPQLFDLTPFGKIRLVEHICEGLIHVEFFRRIREVCYYGFLRNRCVFVVLNMKLSGAIG